MSTVENQGTEGLWRRTPSLLPEESDRPEALSVQANMDNDSNSIGTSPLLNRSASSGENINIEYVESCAHIAAGFLFMLAGTSIVPLFAAAASDSLRTENIPYQKTAAGDIILDLSLSHPVKDPATIPSNFLIFTSVVLPFLFLLIVNIYNFMECKRATISRIQMHELRASLCGFFTSIGLSEAVTCTLKLYVSRPRPNFYALCQFDTTTLTCAASSIHKVREATLSFPSGHSSLSFCGMTFMMFYLRGRVAMVTSTTTLPVGGGRSIRLHPYKMVLQTLCCIVPWSYSFFVACSRLVDKWHHPSDVIAGSLLGIASAYTGYHAFFPGSASPKAGIPLSLQQQPQQQQSNSS